jgi:hypothetical protein
MRIFSFLGVPIFFHLLAMSIDLRAEERETEKAELKIMCNNGR